MMRKCDGFTIIELLVSIVIIGIFASIAVPQVGAWFNQFQLNQATTSLFPRIRALRVEAVAQERCTRARFDIDENMVYFDIAKREAGDGSDCSLDALAIEEDWESFQEPFSLADGINLESVGDVTSGDEVYFTFTKHGGSGTINTQYDGAHFATVTPEPEDECDYKTISFETPTGLLLDFKVYDGTYTLTDPPACAEW